MRWTGMHLASTGVCVPGTDSTDEAVTEGRYDAKERKHNGYDSVGVAGGLSAPEMAVRAARTALRRSGHDARDLAVLLHASFHHQGVDHWTPASYIQHELGGAVAPALEVKQSSMGGLAGLVIAMSYLSAHGSDAALVTTADVFGPPVYDRYRSERWVCLGDGATAAVVSRTGGFARVLATSMASDPSLEQMYRGPGFHAAGASPDLPLDLRKRKFGFVTSLGTAEVAARTSAGLFTAVKQALDDAQTGLDQISRFVFTNVGRALLQWDYLDAFGIEESRTTWDWGRRVGHIGAGDHLGGLNHLMETGELKAGDRVLLTGNGIGFSWNCVVLEISKPHFERA